MKQTVLFLEPKGTILEVIRSAGIQGYNIVVFTSDENLFRNAPLPYRTANQYINLIIHIPSWSDEKFIHEKINELSSFLFISGIYYGLDVCVGIGATLRKQFGLNAPSRKTMDLVINKVELRKLLRDKKLSNVKFFTNYQANSFEHWPLEKYGYFKPVRGAGSAYVKKCENLEEFKRARDYWLKGDDTDPSYIKQHVEALKEYFLEESVEGELLSVEAISDRGNFKVLGLLSRILYSNDSTVEMGSCFPYLHPLSKEIVEFVKKVHEVVGFDNGPSHTELIISPKGKIEVIDFNPRFVGADVLQSINFAYETKIENVLLDFALGKKIDIPNSLKNFSCLQYLLLPNIYEFESIDFPEDLFIKFSTSYIEPFTKIKSRERQSDYAGCYLTVTSSFQESLDYSRNLREKILINKNYKGVF